MEIQTLSVIKGLRSTSELAASSADSAKDQSLQLTF